MADAASNYLENKWLDHSLGTTTFTKPTTVYVALYTTNPTDADSGTEVTGGTYTRQSATWSSAASGSTSNPSDIVFTLMPAATVTHFGIRDASSGGNLLYYGAFTASKTTTAGDTLTIPATGLVITVS